jgi:hypothetical protein
VAAGIGNRELTNVRGHRIRNPHSACLWLTGPMTPLCSLFPIPCSLRYNALMLVRLCATNYRGLMNFEWQKIRS